MSINTQKVTLSRKWSSHREGAAVVVDDVRAQWLKDNGYASEGAHRKSTKKEQ